MLVIRASSKNLQIFSCYEKAVAKTASRTEWAERRLRATIVSGQLAPGARIRVEDLAAEWDVSPTPLREAVRTLAGEGLIVLQPQRGARVAELSAEETLDVYATRILLEPMVLRLSLERADEPWRNALDQAWNALERAHGGDPQTPLDFEPAHADFHQALLAACGSPSLLRICAQLATQSLRYSVLTGSDRSRIAEGRREHRALYRAVIAGDEAGALSIAAAHLGRAARDSLGPVALEVLLGRVRDVQGTAAPVLEGLTSL
jgi:GntR family transcriptional regulator, carbon starvation induced regulator